MHQKYYTVPRMTLVALALSQAFASQAMAQVAPVEANTVIVKGIRASAESSLSIKKNAMEVVDSITADDIGKLPDPNVAETLTRLPGVQGYRYGGEGASPGGNGSGLTIRGLSNQTASQVNGRAYFTAGSREFNIEDAVPAMVAGIDVYKNPSAEHVEGAIGGLINLRTRNPSDFKEFTAVVNGSMRYNDLVRKKEPEVSGLLANRFDLGGGSRIGVMAAFAYQKTTSRNDAAGTNGGMNYRRMVRGDSAEYANLAAANTGNNVAQPMSKYVGRSDITYLAPVDLRPASGTTAPNVVPDTSKLTPAEAANIISANTLGPWPSVESIARTRKALNLAADYRVNNTLRFYTEGAYTSYLYNQNYLFTRIFNDYGGNVQNLTLTPFTINEYMVNRNANGGSNDLVTSQRALGGTFLNQPIGTWGGDEHSLYTTWNVATGVEWSPTPALSLKGDINYIRADRIKDNRRVEMGNAPGQYFDITRVNQNWNDGHYTDIHGNDWSDPAKFVFQKYSGDGYQEFHDNGAATALSGIYTFEDGFFSRLKFGTRFAHQTNRYFDKNPYNGGKWLTTDGKPLAADYSNAISAASKPGVLGQAPTNMLGNQNGYTGGFVVYNPDALLGNQVAAQFPQANIIPEGSYPEYQLGRRYLNENTLAGYVSTDFAAFDDRLKGNVGVRVVRTKSQATARVLSDPAQATSPLIDNTKTTTYTNVLPALNFTYDIAKDFLARFGYGRGLTRPNLDLLNPNYSYNFGNGTVNVGNPDLSPQKADSVDLSLERYFSPTNYVALGLFNKDISGFFSQLSSCGMPQNAVSYTGPSNGCSNGQWMVSKNVNAANGYARGVELSGQWFFNDKDSWLKNFGVAGSYTYVDTSAPLNIGTNSAPIFIDAQQNFVSKNSYSLTSMYEDSKLSARLVYTWRSSQNRGYNGLIPLFSTYIGSYGLLDGSINYAIDEHLTLSFNASNITNTAPNRYAGEVQTMETGREYSHMDNGRSFSLGLRYKF
ncbi:TonB-dependent receptor [Telluria mixta]|uniref:TonB-dependent receptor n=1 Tax=Telluria mixta TaxID=34071 RepID=A0ABT2C0Y7_9BURK|nr:TonB-dependent receptor [Telluria mixta]MCS0631047.1 TonB-dependent receptor [Telluria mixta]WEM95593.1 TonB-dependent receptor [Telluria mixta]